MKPVVFHDLAVAELVEAAAWYEERKGGLGAEFRTAVEDAVRRIQDNPQAGSRFGGSKFRFGLVRRFPVRCFLCGKRRGDSIDGRRAWPPPSRLLEKAEVLRFLNSGPDSLRLRRALCYLWTLWQLESFLLELGTDFTLVARQKERSWSRLQAEIAVSSWIKDVARIAGKSAFGRSSIAHNESKERSQNPPQSRTGFLAPLSLRSLVDADDSPREPPCQAPRSAGREGAKYPIPLPWAKTIAWRKTPRLRESVPSNCLRLTLTSLVK